MRVCLALLALLATMPVRAESVPSLRLSLDGRQVTLVRDPKLGALLSSDCSKPQGFDCQAARALKAASLETIPKSALVGGRRAGVVICIARKGRTALATNAVGNQVGVCEFSDHSLVLPEALEAHARSNDEAAEQRQH